MFSETIQGIIIVVLGVLLIVFSKSGAQKDFNRKSIIGDYLFKNKEPDKKDFKVEILVRIVGGIFLVVMGLIKLIW